jgi:hypothetical protein
MRLSALMLAGVIGFMGMGCEPVDERRPADRDPATTQPRDEPLGRPADPQPREPAQPGAQDQQQDQRIAEEIRQRIQQTELSPQGKQVTITVQQRQVTLTGYVQDESERQLIEQIAADVAGPGNVQNRIQVQ